MMKRLFKWLSFLIAPPFCRSCRVFLSERLVFCTSCRSLINPIIVKDHELTGTKTMRVFAISDYQEPVKSLITAKLYGDIAASKQIGQLIWQMTPISTIEFDYLIPIPLHWMRYARRGFNQAEEIAKELNRLSGKPIAHLAKRAKATAYQSTLDRKERESNVKEAFQIKAARSIYEGKRLLIVDDLFTTGATAHALARELLKLRPQSIDIVVACRTI